MIKIKYINDFDFKLHLNYQCHPISKSLNPSYIVMDFFFGIRTLIPKKMGF